MKRAMTAAEKTRFRRYFPRLNVNRAVVTDNATNRYNCISWTVGVTNRWIWPGAHISNFDTFYRRYGYARSSNGPIAAWGHSKSNMTHGCISGSGHGPRWESKCGSDLRIQHGLNELVGASYGRVVAFYSSRQYLITPFVSKQKAAIKKIKDIESMKLSKKMEAVLNDTISTIDKDIRKKFEDYFDAWKHVWKREEFQHLSDPGFVKYCKEFQDLVSLGETIIPLLVKKLTDPKNFFALQLYDAIQSDEKLVVSIDPEGDDIFEGEQGRAQRVVDYWLKSI